MIAMGWRMRHYAAEQAVGRMAWVWMGSLRLPLPSSTIGMRTRRSSIASPGLCNAWCTSGRLQEQPPASRFISGVEAGDAVVHLLRVHRCHAATSSAVGACPRGSRRSCGGADTACSALRSYYSTCSSYRLRATSACGWWRRCAGARRAAQRTPPA